MLNREHTKKERPNLTSYEEVINFLRFGLAVHNLKLEF